MRDLHRPPAVLSRWWRGAVAVSAAFAADAGFSENRALAFVTLALCAALMVYAAAAVVRSQERG